MPLSVQRNTGYTCPFCGRPARRARYIQARYCWCCGTADNRIERTCEHRSQGRHSTHRWLHALAWLQVPNFTLPTIDLDGLDDIAEHFENFSLITAQALEFIASLFRNILG